VGSLAMANTGSPDSGGAQMFFITGPNGVSLPPSYSLFGQVTEGLDVLQKINEVPSVQTDTNDGAPTEQVTIDKVTIEES
jgi:cyclophilin family peptidyl-prolyl cis-trans isomerase